MIVAGIDYSTSSPAICITDTSKGPAVAGNIKWFNAGKLAKREGLYGDFLEVAHIPNFANKSLSLPKCHHAYWRNKWLADWAIDVLVSNGVEEVLMEDYAMSAVGRITGIAENTGMLKARMAERGIPFTTPSVTEIKKTFAGAGRCPKSYEPSIPGVTKADFTKAWMIDAFIRRTGIDLHVDMQLHLQDSKPIEMCIYNKPIDDCVDAYAIMIMSPNVESE